MKIRTAMICVLLGGATLVASDKPRFESSPRLDTVTIDGRFDDWPGNAEPFGDKPLSVQFQNDGEFLYMRFASSDPSTRAEIMRQGLTVWFDPAGGTKKHFGVRYPVVDRGQYGETERRGRGGYGGGSGGGYGSSESSPTERVDILGPGKNDARELTRDHLPGIDVALHTEQGVLQYELKVPLRATGDRPMAIEAQEGKPIGFGFDTPKPEQSFGRGGTGGYGGRGGRIGIGGRGGGGMGRGGGQSREFQAAKSINGWGVVSLSAGR